jgi:hypothetical protein
MVEHLIAAFVPALIVTRSRLTNFEGRSMLRYCNRP